MQQHAGVGAQVQLHAWQAHSVQAQHVGQVLQVGAGSGRLEQRGQVCGRVSGSHPHWTSVH